MRSMEPAALYDCLCEPTRLRILRLLDGGPLCVCHIHEALDAPQAKVSKHLAYLKDRGLVHAERHANWIIYALPAKRPALLAANLDLLRTPAPGDKVFRADDARVKAIRATFATGAPDCLR